LLVLTPDEIGRVGTASKVHLSFGRGRFAQQIGGGVTVYRESKSPHPDCFAIRTLPSGERCTETAQNRFNKNSSRFSFLFAHDLLGKLLRTFPNHASGRDEVVLVGQCRERVFGGELLAEHPRVLACRFGREAPQQDQERLGRRLT
ncbi:hypothetical protein T4C_8092, partial [Trichinella pseudospiralis]